MVLEKSSDDDWWKAKKKNSPDEDDEEPEGLIPNNYIEEVSCRCCTQCAQVSIVNAIRMDAAESRIVIYVDVCYFHIKLYLFDCPILYPPLFFSFLFSSPTLPILLPITGMCVTSYRSLNCGTLPPLTTWNLRHPRSTKQKPFTITRAKPMKSSPSKKTPSSMCTTRQIRTGPSWASTETMALPQQTTSK